jgi:hypothetical protein
MEVKILNREKLAKGVINRTGITAVIITPHRSPDNLFNHVAPAAPSSYSRRILPPVLIQLPRI